MKGIVRKLLLILVAFAIILIPSKITKAETLEERINNLIKPESMYNTMVSPSYQKNNAETEEIDRQSGELNLTQIDYSLPGRNGLDLNIGRIYKSGSAQLWETQIRLYSNVWISHQNTTDRTFYENRYGLGAGQRFTFPTMEIKSNTDGSSFKFLHTENGTVYSLIGPIYVNGKNTYNIENYALKDILIYENNNYTNGQSDGTSKYVMEDKNGKKTYFSDDGRILGIVDRYNNKINFEYSNIITKLNSGRSYNQRLITKVTDSLGRIVGIEYNNGAKQGDGSYRDNGDNKNYDVCINLPNNKTIKYKRDMSYVIEDWFDRGQDVEAEYVANFIPIITQVIDCDNKTKYQFEYNYTPGGDIMYNTGEEDQLDSVLRLSKVSYPKENKTRTYEYSPYKSVYNIDKFKVTASSDAIKRCNYTYINEPDGYGCTDYKKGDKTYLTNVFRYSSEELNEKGIKTKYTYNGLNELLSIEQNGQDHKQITSFAYDDNKQIKEKETKTYNDGNANVSDKSSKKTENFAYDSYGNLVSYTGPLASRDDNGNPINNEYTSNYTYATDRYNILTSKTWKKDANTICRVEYDVDSLGNIEEERQMHKENGINKPIKTDYDYDIYGNMTKKVENGSNITNYEYGIDADGANQNGGYLTKEYWVINGNVIAKKYAYNFLSGNMTAEVDPNNNRKSIAYDDLSRVTRITFPDNSQQTYDYYDTDISNGIYNRRIVYTDPNKTKFAYEYDIHGNLVKYSINNNVIKSIMYDSDNNKTKEIDALGNSIRYVYDSANRLLVKSFWENDCIIKKYMRNSYNTGYDSNTALLVNETDEEGYITNNYYDILNRLIKKVTTPDKTNYYTSNYSYDYSNNKLSESDNKNNVTQYTYDDLNRLTMKKDPLGNTTQYIYNANNKLIEEKNAKNISIYYDYDDLGRMIRKKVPSTDGALAVTRFIYDNIGNKIKEISPNSYNSDKDTPDLAASMDGISYTYDCMNRVKSITSAENKLIEYRNYDGDGNLSKVVDGLRYNGDINTSLGKSFIYDAWGRVTQTTDALGNKESYNYDLVGNLLSYTNANGKKTSYIYNSDRTLAQVTYDDGGTIKYTYDNLGHKLTQEDQRGNVTRYAYNGYGKITQVYDPYNNAKNYVYDENGNLKEEHNYDNSVTYYNYDANNQLKVKKSPLEYDQNNNIIYSIENYDYDEIGNVKYKALTGTKDSASKRETNITYYNNGLVNTITTNAGGYTKNYYDKNGNMIKNEKLKDSGVYSVEKNVYDKNNRIIKSINLEDEKNIYNASNFPNIVNIRDNDYPGKIQLITGYEYDILGNVTKIIDPRAYSYLESDSLNRNKYSTIKTYDILNRLEKELWKYNNNDVYKQYYYDPAGNKIKERNEKGNFIEYTYDGLNRLKTVKDALGKTMTYGYDLAGNKVTETNSQSSTVTYVYDKINRLITIIDPYGLVINEKVYDVKGNVIKSIDAKGYKSGSTDASRYGTSYTYDLANRLTKVVDPEIASLNDASKYTAKNEYNQFGEKTKEINALGNETKYEYNNAGKLTKVIDANNIATQYTYDMEGNKLSTIDGNNNTTIYNYGNQGILIAAVNADNKTITYQYDLALNKARIVDRNGSEQIITYDFRNLILAKNIPSTGDNISYSYDEVGNRIKMIDATGTINYTFNANNWLTNVSKDGASQVVYTYDSLGNVLSVKDKKAFTTTYEYDKCSRLTKVGYAVSGSIKYTNYGYDENGNRNSISYSGGVKEEYYFDKNNKLIGLVNRKPDGSYIARYSYVYDLAGRQIRKIDDYGITTYMYDNLGRIQQITAPGKTTVFTYDNVGNRIGLNETYTSDQASEYQPYSSADISYRNKSINYTYSKNNLLLSINESMSDKQLNGKYDRKISYLYDNNGNEISQSIDAFVPGETVTYTPTYHDDDGNVLNFSGGGSSSISSKVKNSEITTKNKQSEVQSSNLTPRINSLIPNDSSTQPREITVHLHNYINYFTCNQYDGFNRLKKSSLSKKNSGTAIEFTVTEYTYNGDDLRVKKVVTKEKDGNKNVEQTNYLYDRQNVILETDANDNVKVRYIKGINYIARIDKQEKLSYYLFNGHGDVVQTTSENGTVENQYDYDIFGNATLTIETYGNSIRYGGEFFDPDGGLYYLRSRYYDPSIARFITEDSYWGSDSNPLSLNLYTYCENDPINFLDPTGHYPDTVSYDPKTYSNSVVQLQQELNSQYGYDLKVDGYFGKDTLAAVRDFQGKHNCQVDGIVGPQTWGAIMGGGGGTKSSNPKPQPKARPRYDTLKYDPSQYDPEVKVLQEKLNTQGYNLKADGYFGQGTLDAVNDFQKENGLDVDGIVGAATWRVLNKFAKLAGYSEKEWDYLYEGGIKADFSRVSKGTVKTSSDTTVERDPFPPSFHPTGKPVVTITQDDIDAFFFAIAQPEISEGLKCISGALSYIDAKVGSLLSEETRFAKGAAEANSIRYSPVNPGPLKPSVAETFTGGSYTQTVLSEDTTFYRVYGGDAKQVGSYMSRVPQNGGIQSQIDLALKPEWGNSTEYVTKVIVPKGTTIYEGTAAQQTLNETIGGTGQLIGGGNQVYIPWEGLNSNWFVK